jgi:hypothetical protein
MFSTVRTPSSWKFSVMEIIAEHTAAQHTEIILENLEDSVSQVTIGIVASDAFFFIFKMLWT